MFLSAINCSAEKTEVFGATAYAPGPLAARTCLRGLNASSCSGDLMGCSMLAFLAALHTAPSNQNRLCPASQYRFGRQAAGGVRHSYIGLKFWSLLVYIFRGALRT